MSNPQDAAYDRIYQRFELDVLDKVVAEVASGRMNDEGRVRATIRKDLEKVLTNNLEEDYQLKFLVNIGRALCKAHELPLAKECFEKVILMLTNYPSTPKNVQLRVEAMHGIIGCEHSKITSNSRFLIAPMSMGRLLANLGRVRESVDMLLELKSEEREKLAWLILNACKLVYSIGQPLLLMGCSRYVAESLIYASLAMDAVINLCTARHLEFKMKLNTSAIAAMLTYAPADETRGAIEYAAKVVRELREREELDPPLTDRTVAVLAEAETDISVQRVVLKFWTDTESLVLTKLYGPHDDKSLPRSSASASDYSFSERCLLECIRVQQLTAGNINEPWKKRTSSLVRAFMAYTEPVDQKDSTEGDPTGPREALPSVSLSVRCLVDVMALAMFDVLDGVDAHDVLSRIRLMVKHSVNIEGDASVIDLEVMQFLAEHMGTGTPETAVQLVNYLESIIHSDEVHARKGLLQKVGLAVWSKIIYPCLQEMLCGNPPSNAASPNSTVQKTVAPLLSAVRALDICGIEDPVLMGSVSLVVAHLINIAGDARRCISLLTKALETIDSHRAARVDLQLHLPEDVRDIKAMQHASFTCRSDSATQWMHAAKRLGAHAFAGFGIFGTASSMAASDQALADIHTDLLMLLVRTELEYGIATRHACMALKASTAKSKKQPEATEHGRPKDATSNSRQTTKGVTFGGTVTAGGATVASDGSPSVQNGCENVEKLQCVTTLKSTWAKSTYGRCILYLEMARVELVPAMRRKYLKDAVGSVREAEHNEDSILKAFENLHVVTDSTSVHPIVLARSHAFFYVAPVANKKNNWAHVSYLRVFGREEGSGTDVSATSDELSGCDQMVPVESMHSPSAAGVQIGSLRLGEKYVFANGAFDETGKLLGHVSPTSISVEAVNPLPTLLLWSHIATLAYECGFIDLALQSANTVCDYFIKVADPHQNVKSYGKGMSLFIVDQYFLNMLAVQQASPMQLKLFVKCFVLVESVNVDKYREDLLADSSSADVAIVNLHWNFRKQQQLNILRSTVRLSHVTTIASMLQDHELILRCACLAHTLVAQSLLFDSNQMAQYLANPIHVFITALQVTNRKSWRELDHHLYCRMLIFAAKCAVINGNTSVMGPILERLHPMETQEPFADEEPGDGVKFKEKEIVISPEILQEYGGVLHALRLKGGEMASSGVLDQMNALLGIGDKDTAALSDIWSLSVPARVNAISEKSAKLLDADGELTGVLEVIQKQLCGQPPAASDILTVLVGCAEELDRINRGDSILTFLEKYPVRKDILADGVLDDCSKWNIEFVKDINSASPQEEDDREKQESSGEEEAKRSAREDVETYKNPATTEVKLQFKGIASLCFLIAEGGFRNNVGRNDYLDSNLGPFVKLSRRDLMEGISESCLEHQKSGLDDTMGAEEPNPADMVENSEEAQKESAIQYTKQDYIRHICIAIVMFTRAECFQAAVNASGKLWSYVLNKWYDPKSFAEDFFTIKSYLLAAAESIVKLTEAQTAVTSTNEAMATEAGAVMLPYCHPRDIKDNLYILKDPFVFITKVLCLLKESKDVVDFGSRMLDVFIYHAPQFAKVVCDGVMSYLIFAQEEIIADCLDKVRLREKKLQDFVTAYEEAQARKRKKKLRIARAEKSDEELKFEADKGALQEKLNRAQSVHEANCNRKDMLERLEKRVDGIYSTGQQLFDKVRESASLFLVECREALRHSAARDTTFAQLLEHKPFSKKFDEIVHHYDQVSQFLREKKDRITLVDSLHEQGDFLVLFDKIDLARAAWRDAVDGLFNALDAWKYWQEVTDEALHSLDDSICRSAIPIIIVLGKLSRHCSENDMDLKSNYCQMAARICRLPFMESIGHPHELHGFAAYNCVELGGKAPLEFNREVFTAFSFQSSLEEVVRVLGSEQMQLQCLPIIVLLEHFNGYYTRRADKWIEARMKRVEFLAELHMFAEATAMLAGAIPTMKAISNGLFGDLLGGAVHGTVVGSDGTISKKVDSTAANGLEYFNNPPFFNNRPPEDADNQTALQWIATYPEFFAKESSGFIVVLPPVVKTEEQLEAEGKAAEAAAEAAAKAAKGKKGKEEVPPPPVKSGPETRPLLSKFHHAEMAVVCSLLLMNIAFLDGRACVKHHTTLVAAKTTATELLSRASTFLVEKKSKVADNDTNVERKESDILPNSFNDEGPCVWGNSNWISLYRRCRILHIKGLFWNKDYKTCRATLLSLVQQLSTVSGVFGDAKYELTQLWFTAKQLLIETANLQGRFQIALVLASQSVQEAAAMCSGYWIRSLVLRRAQVFLKTGNLSASEDDCQLVLKSFESAKIISMASVRTQLLLNSVIHSKSLNMSYNNAVDSLGKCVTVLREALSHAKLICKDRGFVSADLNITFENKPTVVMKHDRFTPFHHSNTTLYENYPDLVAFESFMHKSNEDVIESGTSSFNGYLRPGPVDREDIYVTSVLSSIYIEEIRVLCTCYNALCVLVDELRMANLGVPEENHPDLSATSLLKEQVISAEEGLKVMRYVVYPSPYVKCGLLLSAGKARVSESTENTMQGNYHIV